MSEKDIETIRRINDDLRCFVAGAQAMHRTAEQAAQALRTLGQAAAKAAPGLHVG